MVQVRRRGAGEEVWVQGRRGGCRGEDCVYPVNNTQALKQLAYVYMQLCSET